MKTSSSSQESGGSGSDNGDGITDDPFADFGASVNINEELRHTIRGEILDLDEAIGVHKASVTAEQKTDIRLNNELSHARAEMGNLSCRASGQLNHTNLQSEIITGLMDSVHLELLMDGSRDDESKRNEEPETAGPDKSHLTTAISRGSRKKEILQKRLFKIQSSVESNLDKARALEAELRTIKESELEQSLAEELKNAIARSKKSMEESESGRRRLDSLQGDLEQSREQCGIYARQVADNTNELNLLARENESREGELSQQITRIKEEEAKLSKSAEDLDEKSLIVDAQTKQLLLQIQEYDRLCGLRADTERELSDLERKKAISDATFEKLEEEHEDVRKRVKSHEKGLAEAQSRMQEALAAKVTNDDLEKNEFLPGEVELANLGAAKEKLAKAITNNHDEIASERISNSRIISDSEEALASVSKSLALAKEANESEATKKANLERIYSEARTNWNRQVEESQARESDLNKAIEEEKATIEMAEAEMRAESEARIAAASAERDRVVLMEKMELEVFEFVMGELESASRKISELEKDME